MHRDAAHPSVRVLFDLADVDPGTDLDAEISNGCRRLPRFAGRRPACRRSRTCHHRRRRSRGRRLGGSPSEPRRGSARSASGRHGRRALPRSPSNRPRRRTRPPGRPVRIAHGGVIVVPPWSRLVSPSLLDRVQSDAVCSWTHPRIQAKSRGLWRGHRGCDDAGMADLDGGVRRGRAGGRGPGGLGFRVRTHRHAAGRRARRATRRRWSVSRWSASFSLLKVAIRGRGHVDGSIVLLMSAAAIVGMPLDAPGPHPRGRPRSDGRDRRRGDRVLRCCSGMVFGCRSAQAPAAAGFTAGVLSTSTGTNGPVVIAPRPGRCSRRCSERRLAIFLVQGSASLVFFAIGGQITRDAVSVALAGLPGVIVGSIVGERGFRRLDASQVPARRPRDAVPVGDRVAVGALVT